MTDSEYSEFWKELKTAWPALQDWIRKLAEPAETFEVWYATVFERLELADCQTVIAETIAGRMDQPPFGKIPAFFRRECGALHWDRVKAEEKGREHWRGAHEALRASGAGPAFRKAQAMISALKRQGKTPAEAVALVNGPMRDQWAELITAKRKP